MGVRPYGIGILHDIVAIKHRPPTAADDVNFAYHQGQFWIDEAHGKCYQCVNHLPAGAAVWVEISGGGGGSGFVWRGTWSSSDSYAVNDAVSYNNGSYICTQANVNQVPTNGAPYWDVLAAPGSGISQAYADTHYRAIGSFIFTQGVPSALWTITHNLGTFPAVTVRDSTGDVVETGVRYLNANQLQIFVSNPFSGSALLT